MTFMTIFHQDRFDLGPVKLDRFIFAQRTNRVGRLVVGMAKPAHGAQPNATDDQSRVHKSKPQVVTTGKSFESKHGFFGNLQLRCCGYVAVVTLLWLRCCGRFASQSVGGTKTTDRRAGVPPSTWFSGGTALPSSYSNLKLGGKRNDWFTWRLATISAFRRQLDTA
jgi:hypothetical protein